MKKNILVLTLLTVLLGCEPKPFRGFLVCKEYVKGHMDNERPYVQQEAYVPIVPITMSDEPEYVPSAWVFYVANKDGVRRFSVDSLTYTRYKVGERIAMK